MRHCIHLISITLGAALTVALVVLANVVVIESASAQVRPAAPGLAARQAARPAQARPRAGTSQTLSRPVRSQLATPPPQAAANRARVGQRNAQARSATGDTRRYGVNLGNATSPLNWPTWNRATRPTTAAPAPQRVRQSRSGRTVAFRAHRSTAASATTARPGPAASVYRSAPTQRRAVANQTRATLRATSGRAAVGDGRRNAVNLGTASPVSTWSGWNRASNVLGPAATPPRTRQSRSGRQVTFRETRASVELQRLRRDPAGNIIAP